MKTKMKNKEKDFDAVKMMREIREKLREKYEANPRLREKKLKEIHAKYGLKPKTRHYPANIPPKENLHP